MKKLARHFLVASPQLLDPNFVKTVTLLIEHTDQGAFGVVLNRPSTKMIQELWSDLGDSPCKVQRPVHLGGPVPGPLLAIHTNQFFAEMEILPGIFLASKKDNLDNLVLHGDDPLRVFVGNAGWGAGQLESELEAGGWLTMPASSEYVFYDGDDLWERTAREIGHATLQSMLHLKHIPDDPSSN